MEYGIFLYEKVHALSVCIYIRIVCPPRISLQELMPAITARYSSKIRGHSFFIFRLKRVVSSQLQYLISGGIINQLVTYLSFLCRHTCLIPLLICSLPPPMCNSYSLFLVSFSPLFPSIHFIYTHFYITVTSNDNS